MTFSEETYKKIDAYIKGSMSIPEREAFEKELHENPGLAEEVDIIRRMPLQYGEASWYFAQKDRDNPTAKALKTYFRSEETQMLSDKIRQIQARHRKPAPGIRHRRFFYYAAALIIVLFLTGNFFVSFTSLENMYNNNQERSISRTLSERSNNAETSDETLMKGIQLFKQKEYTEATSHFQNYLKQNSINPESNALILLGFCYTETLQYQKAIATFDRLLNDGELLNYKQAHWYKALTYVKQGDKEKARQQLKIILSNPEYPYFEEAKALNRELKKISLTEIFK